MGFGAVEGEPPGGQNPRLSESAPGASGGLRGGLGVAPVLSWGPWGPKRAQKRPMRAHGALGAPPWAHVRCGNAEGSLRLYVAAQ